MSRDFIQWFPNQRVDLPDFIAVQRNMRAEARSAFQHFLFGSDIATPAFAKRTLGGWSVAEDSGGPSSIIEITAGTAVGIQDVPGGDQDQGVMFGLIDGPAQQNLDLIGLPADTYTVWVRFSEEPGAPGARVFWNAGTEQEDVDNIDTRLVVSWDVVAATSIPSVEYQRIAEVVWDAVSVDNADITHRRKLFFEGDEQGGFAFEWGSGTDRNIDRGSFGVFDMATWVAAVRRQLAEIISLGANDWFEQPPADLTEARAHIDDSTDPHGSPLTQTDLIVLGEITVGSGIPDPSAFFNVDKAAGFVNMNTSNGVGITISAGGTGQGFIFGNWDTGFGDWVFKDSSQSVEIEGDFFCATGGGIATLRVTESLGLVEVNSPNVFQVHDIQFATPNAQYLTVPGVAFATDDTGSVLYGAPGEGLITADGGTVIGFASIHDIPEGVVLDQIRTRVTGVLNDTVAMSINKRNLSTGTNTVIANTGNVNMSGGRQTITTNFADETIDHSDFYYYLRLALTPTGVSDPSLESVRVRFTATNLYPP